MQHTDALRAWRSVPVMVLAMSLMLLSPTAAGAFPLLEPPERVPEIGPSLVVLDYDDDGFVDLAGLADDGTLTLRLGTSTGFAAPQTMALAGAAFPNTLTGRSVVASDVTGDGRDDIVATFGSSATLVIVRGRADGTLVTPPAGDVHAIGAPTTGYVVPTALAIGDVDADGDRDVATAIGTAVDFGTPPSTAQDGHITIFVNSGDGALAPSATTLPVNAPADLLFVALAGDADPDLVVAQMNQPPSTAVRVLPGASGASFAAEQVVPAGAQATELDAGDFNADGRPDLVVGHGAVGSNSAQPASILPGTAAAASLGAPITVPAADGEHIVVADLDRDGRDDLYVARGQIEHPLPGVTDNPIFVRGLGSLAFAARDQSQIEDLPRFESSPQVADVDGDGKLDIVTSGWEGNVPPDNAYIRYGLGPQLVPTPEDWDFGVLGLGARSAAQSFSFTNIGPGTASAITRESVGDDADYPIVRDTCSGATLAVGQACALDIAFAPTQLGDRALLIAAFAPDADYIYPAGLIGTGEAVSPPPPPPPQPPPTSPARPPAPTGTVRPTPKAKAKMPIVTPTTRRGLLRRGLRFTQSFTGAGSASWTLELPTGAVVARGKRTIARPGVVRMQIALKGAGRRVFNRRHATKLVLRTSFKPAGAKTRVQVRTVVRL